MPTEPSAVASSIAAADKRLESLSVLCGILSGTIDRARRDLRQIRSDVADAQKREESGHAPAGEISADMLAG
jgi:hypothetical protein